MIINIYTIIMMFIAAVSLALGIVLLFVTLKALSRLDAVHTLESATTHEKSGYLIFLLACVVLSMRMLAWPWFYFMLQSFVMEVPGAMCIYGVTQILPSTVRFLQIIKPISFFIMGGWFLCYFVDKKHPTSPLARRNLIFLLPICALLLIDSAADIYYVLYMKPLMSVSCCATFYDLPFRSSAMIPQAIFGGNFTKPLLLLYYCINLILIALLSLSLYQKWASRVILPEKVVRYSRSVAVIVNIPIVFIAFLEVIAPRLMHLPLHHCIYCFLGNGMVPDAPIILGFFILGTFAVGWMSIIRFICLRADTDQVAGKLLLRVNSLSVFCLVSSLIMVTVHFIFT
jgi:hypothetical protein